MFPVSGAEQLNTSEDQCTRPMTSASGAYSRLVSPAPAALAGKNRFQSPAALATGFRRSTTGTGRQRSVSAACSSL